MKQSVFVESNPQQAKDSNKVEDGNTCKAYKDGETKATNMLFGNSDLSDFVSTTFGDLHFDGKTCGEDPKLNEAGTNLVYSALIGKLPTLITSVLFLQSIIFLIFYS